MKKIGLLADAEFQAMVPESALNAGKYDGKYYGIPWPAMGDVNAVLGGYDGLFIPSNAKNPEASFAVIKAYLSEEVQKIYADGGMSIVNPNVEITDEAVKKMVEMSSIVQTAEFMTLDAKINDYLTNEALAELVLGGGVEATQQALEALRQAAVQ